MLNTKLFDHTILKADATEAQVAKICDEALAHDFASVCVNQYYTKFVALRKIRCFWEMIVIFKDCNQVWI